MNLKFLLAWLKLLSSNLFVCNHNSFRLIQRNIKSILCYTLNNKLKKFKTSKKVLIIIYNIIYCKTERRKILKFSLIIIQIALPVSGGDEQCVLDKGWNKEAEAIRSRLCNQLLLGLTTNLLSIYLIINSYITWGFNKFRISDVRTFVFCNAIL